jgi:glycosidase
MEKILVSILAVFMLIAFAIGGCSMFSKKKALKSFKTEVVHPEWSKNAVIYEVNVRQYTDSGTFKAFEKHLPRLKEMGIDILWFMPIYPIGVPNRKGEMGSYYSVADYLAVNPEFGTIGDFKRIIDKAHDQGMHVILDWVPNHTSWDNPLTISHPEWYAKDSTGRFTPPIGTDWTDVIQLDWSQPELHDYMIEAFKFWINLGADGFRVDHPHNTPKEFWERARTELDKIKPVFMLAEYEGDKGFTEKGFDMDYAWEMHHLMNNIAQGKDSANAMLKYFRREWAVYPENAYRLMFLTNHDENSWAGTIDSLMGNSQRAFATLIFTAAGMPLIYSGQEACLDKKLKFFFRDPIEWDTCTMTGFYSDLIKLKKSNRALWNGSFGGKMTNIKTNKERKVFAFYRQKDENRVAVFLNLNKRPVTFKPVMKGIEGDYTEYFTGQKTAFDKSVNITLDPWGYQAFVK